MKKYQKEEILMLDKESIQKIGEYLNHPLFEKDRIQQSSTAIYYLSVWIKTVYEFYVTYGKIIPKQEKNEELQENVDSISMEIKENKNKTLEQEETLNLVYKEYHKFLKDKSEIDVKYCKFFGIL